MDLVRQFLDDSKEQPPAIAAAHKLLAEAFARRSDCDELLARHAKHWDLSRLALVDRNILRLAASELRPDRRRPRSSSPRPSNSRGSSPPPKAPASSTVCWMR